MVLLIGAIGVIPPAVHVGAAALDEDSDSSNAKLDKWLIVTDLPKPSTPIATTFKSDATDQQKIDQSSSSSSSTVNKPVQWADDQLTVPSFRTTTTYSRGEAKAAVFVQAGSNQERDEVRRQARHETIYNAMMEETKMLLWITQLPGYNGLDPASWLRGCCCRRSLKLVP
ncbi:hypothetical protein PG994_013490 [Apiospora phragmitis]|uniref:Uncharacterized protein n=1 Tax=Apiospora phragmitis TaxID=2905665 RepID=A0ABR1T8R9_9PEZI